MLQGNAGALVRKKRSFTLSALAPASGKLWYLRTTGYLMRLYGLANRLQLKLRKNLFIHCAGLPT
jgi:hypothetical protein